MDGNNSIQNCCRICASNPPDLRNIFEVVFKGKPLSDILGQCLKCTIYRTEYFPEYICSQCCADLLKMYKFIENYEKNEKLFISRYNAINEARIIKTETEINVYPTEQEQNPEISIQSKHQIFVDSSADVVSTQDVPRNPLELKEEEFDHDYDFGVAESPSNPIDFQNQEMNETNCHEQRENATAAYCNGINEVTVRKATQIREIIHHVKESKQYQCSICSKQLLNQNCLRLHENLHTGKKTFKCYFCDEMFRRSDYRVKHIRKIHPEVEFECFVCQIIFNTYYELCQHMLEGDHSNSPENESNLVTKVSRKRMDGAHHEEETKQYQCSTCFKQFLNLNNLKIHENLHTGKKTFKCYFCDETFRRSDYRVNHIRKIHPEVVFECSTCKLRFNTYNELGQHTVMHGDRTLSHNESNHVMEVFCKKEIIHHEKETKQYQCSICSKSFLNLNNLRIHENLHSGKKTFECYFCDEIFRRSDYRVIHIRKMHPEVIFECFVCQAVFSTFYELSQHMLEGDHSNSPGNESHLVTKVSGNERDRIRHEKGNEQYQCRMCSKEFLNLRSLRLHENLHTGKKIFGCPFCPETFWRSDSRVKHIRKMRRRVYHDTARSENRYICEVCGKSCSNKTDLKYHQIKHSDEKRFKCVHQDCQKVFKRKPELGEHLKIHEGKIEHFCECGEGFVLARQLRRHQVIHHRKQETIVASHPCELCFKVFTTKTNLKFHMERHMGKVYQCKYCELKLASRSGRDKHHRNIHEAPRSYECYACRETFDKYIYLFRHMEVHSSNDRVTFECEICFKLFWTENLFREHKRKHNVLTLDCEYCNESFEDKFKLNSHVLCMHADKMEQYQCDQCSKRFPLKSALKTHIYKNHIMKKSLKNHLCTECGYTAKTLGSLRTHMLSHSDERPISCSGCSSRFKYKSQLHVHMMRFHSSAEPTFMCRFVIDGERVCGKKFLTANFLRNHSKKVHFGLSDDRRFACESCPSKFSTKYKLRVHTRIHTGERPYKCDHCDRSFTQKGDMMKHMLIHLGPTPYKCTQCDASFRLPTELRIHSYTHCKSHEN